MSDSKSASLRRGSVGVISKLVKEFTVGNKKRNSKIKYSLPLPGMTNVRDMVAGETRVFSAGQRTPSGPFEGATRGSRAIMLTGAVASQRMMLLVDPVTHETVPVILFHCEKAGNAVKPRGPKPKGGAR